MQDQGRAPTQIVVQTPAPRGADVARASRELASLEARRTELKQQLSSNTERRVLMDLQLKSAEGASRAELQNRLKTLDARTARIDDELNEIDDAINAALERGATRAPNGFEQLIQGMRGTPQPPPTFQYQRNNDLLINLLIGQGVAFLLLAFILWRGLRRRVSASFARLAPEDSNRIEQLQRSVDVMAVEVERISEGQRYVAKIMSEQSSALGAGAAVSARRADSDR